LGNNEKEIRDEELDINSHASCFIGLNDNRRRIYSANNPAYPKTIKTMDKSRVSGGKRWLGK
jgi:hypothetical protein